MKLAITLIEVHNHEFPNIGTIISENGDELELKDKTIEALCSHFDAEISKLVIQDNLRLSDVRNSKPLDAIVYLVDNDLSFDIEIQQTHIY